MKQNQFKVDEMNKETPTLMKSKDRVQKHGEVFTPKWVIDKMTEIPGIREKTEDVFATFLEPSAGEGAFLLAIEDQKLRCVTERYSEGKWETYALWALSSIYGIELLDDNLLEARQKMLDLFLYFYESKRGVPLSMYADIYKSARTIIWSNIVQGNTLTHRNSLNEEIMLSQWKPVEGSSNQVQRISFMYSSLFGDIDISSTGVQTSMFEEINLTEAQENHYTKCYAPIAIEFVWKEDKEVSNEKPVKFKFDVVIGNPPYQEEVVGTSDKPIYNLFMDEAYKIAERVSFITPARFLFNAGKTPKAWNQKMLNDEHLKIEYFEQDSSTIFKNTDIKGGVAVTYRDTRANFGAIGTFTAYPELNRILKKTTAMYSGSFSNIVFGQNIYQYSDVLHDDYPIAEDLLSKGHKYDVTTNAFDRLSFIFFDEKPDDQHQYIQLLGLQNSKRAYKWVRRVYISEPISLNKHKVFITVANGSGNLGEALSTPLKGEPLIGSTQTFLTVGSFDYEYEASAVLKYVCTKFARVLLGVLKVTQHNTSEKWKYVPLQDFTISSDIDWSKSIREIDQQLYKKYGLDESEIEFIETHVKEME